MSRGGSLRPVVSRKTSVDGTWAPEGIESGLSSSRPVRVSSRGYKRSQSRATSTSGSLVSSSRSLMSSSRTATVTISGGETSYFTGPKGMPESATSVYSGGAGYPSVNVPSMRSANPVVASAPSYVGMPSKGIASQSAPYQSFSSTSVPTYGYGNSGEVSLFGSSSSYKSTPSLGGSSPIYKAPPGVAGGTTDDEGKEQDGSWFGWLDYTYGSEEKTSDNGWIQNQDGTWTKTFSESDAESLYDNMMQSWDETIMGKRPPTKDAFMEWLRNGGTKDGNTYKMPLGDIAPLFLLAFAYLAILLIRRKN